MTVIDTAENNEPLQTPGATLRAAREQAGVTQESVAEALLIKLERIRALEDDSCERFCDDVYIRGYLRSYASFLKLDGEDLVSLFDEAKTSETDDSSDTIKHTKAYQRAFIGYAVVLVGLALVFYALFLGYKFVMKDAAVEDSSELPEVSIRKNFSSDESSIGLQNTELQVAEADDLQAVPAATAEDASKVAATQEVQAEKVDIKTEPEVTALTESQVVMSAEALYLSFSKECWLEVRDASGQVLVANLQAKDSEVTLTGTPPFKIKLGHADGVKIKYAEEMVVLPDVKKGKIVNLSVGTKSFN